MKYLSKYSTVALVGLGCGLLLFALRFHYFMTYLQFPIVPGEDTLGHMELGRYFAEHIFPSIWGWAPSWFGGMPFPQFYPPLFYLLVAGISKILFFLSYDLVFRLVITVLTLCIPGALALVAARMTTHRLSLAVAGFCGMFLIMTSTGTYDYLGITMHSTFSIGLVTHLLAFICLCLWIWAYWGSTQSKTSYVLSIIFLALTALSNVHVIPVVVIIYFVTFCYDFFFRREIRKNILKFYIIPGILAIGLSCFWLLPMLSVYSFMPSQSLGLTDGIGAQNVWDIIHTWWPTGLSFLLALVAVIFHRKREALLFLISAALTLAIIFFRFDLLLRSYPFHNYRSLSFIYCISPVAIAYAFDILAYRFKRVGVYISFLFILGIFIFAWWPYKNDQFKDVYANYQKERAFEIADFMKDKTGMFAIEAGVTARALAYVIQEHAGPNLRSAYTVFAESSLSSLFDIPFRTSLSANRVELIAVHSLLNDNHEFRTNKDPNLTVARARKLGIKYLIIESPAMKLVFALDQKDLHLVKNFGVWSVYEVSGVDDAAVPITEPSLMIADLGIKGVESTSLDYFLLQEKAFLNNNLDLTIARADNKYLDDPTEYNNFPTLIVSSYTYHSREKALAALSEYAHTHHLILVASEDPLYTELKQQFSTDSNSHVDFIDYDLSRKGSDKSIEIQMAADKVLAVLEQTKQAQSSTTPVGVTFSQSKITIQLATSSQQVVPVVVNVSYFPSWKRTDGAPVYLVTPSYMLTFATSSAEIDFKTPPIVYGGGAVSLISLVGILIVAFRKRNNN